MSTTQIRSDDTARQSDLLLWVAGGVVAAVAVAWLVISKPWSAGPGSPEPIVATAATPAPASSDGGTPANTAAPAQSAPAAASSGVETTLDNPLRMAELAYEAGMLVEPEEYSAWTLYAQVAEAEPDNAAAIEGLTKVADDLVRRGETALEQGRFDDARSTVERIRAALPDHAGAKALADKIWPNVSTARTPAAETFKPELPVQQTPPTVAPVPVAEQPPPKPAVNPLVEANEEFERAMAASRLLTPSEQSAKHYLEVMVDRNPDHELTREAQRRLSDEFLSRAAQSLEALDAEAAGIWIDEAQGIGVDAAGIETARIALAEHLIAMESAKLLPASELKVASYVAPEYPQRALERRVEGWVDVQFTVATDGTTRDVTVAEASHETYFRREAVTAVEKWRFEPRVFMNRPIEQRSYTRIRFVL
jgi:protein TonB